MGYIRPKAMAWRSTAISLLLLLHIAAGAPNIVLLMTDDHDDVFSGGVDAMPNLARIVGDGGTQFSRFYVTTSQCSPSRASILTGRYAHNHRVLDNGFMNRVTGRRIGGAAAFAAHESRTIATLLRDEADYETALYGKYLVYYLRAAHVPQGWDHWSSLIDPHKFYNGSYSLNGVRTEIPRNVHQTDFLAGTAVEFLRTRNRTRPFFMHLTPFAPHEPSTPAYRHQGLFADHTVPRTRSYDHADDALQAKKGSFVGRMDRLSEYWHDEYNRRYVTTMESLQSVDEMVAVLEHELIALGDWDNTYLFYTSDNGYKAGQHRLGEKALPYEEDIRVPFAVRGPGVSIGRVVDEMTLNIDLAPTWLDLAGVDTPLWMDGRSFAGVLHGASETLPRRAEFAVEATGMGTKAHHRNQENGVVVAHGRFQNCTYIGLRGLDYLYVEWCTGELEYYNTTTDPWQLDNIYDELDNTTAHRLSALLQAHYTCIGSACTTPQPDYENHVRTTVCCVNWPGAENCGDGCVAGDEECDSVDNCDASTCTCATGYTRSSILSNTCVPVFDIDSAVLSAGCIVLSSAIIVAMSLLLLRYSKRHYTPSLDSTTE